MSDAKTAGQRHEQEHELKELIVSCFSNSNVVVEVAAVHDATDQLYPVESALVARAVLSRKREFSTGRLLARKALRTFGLPARALERGAQGEALWPAPLVGSISHTKEWCVVAVADSSSVAGIGIDIETDRFRSEDAKRLILHASEVQAFERIQADVRIRELLRIFSAKEAIYKAIYPSMGRYVDFKEVCIRTDESGDRFIGHAPENRELDLLLSRGEGRSGCTGSLFVSTYVLSDAARE